MLPSMLAVSQSNGPAWWTVALLLVVALVWFVLKQTGWTRRHHTRSR